MEKFREIEDTIRDRTGYGTIGHLIAVMLCDREVGNNDRATEDKIIDAACDKADELWNGIIGPMLDQLEGEVT
ncbi:MAG: hypothetical protein BWY85_01428 [Firmicutes bacterium ADurb.Bin506]|nr:MAG: hypothetical protein BWY85_01428 [Firmicutes bacterium ADurb.Bin506]